jgi:type I restriction enzyme, S subunit
VSFGALKEAIEHRHEWMPSRLKFALLRNDGGVWGDEFDEEGMVVLRSTEVAIDGKWRISDPARRRLSPRDQQVGLLLEGDLLVTKSSGSEDHLGKTALVSKEVSALRAAFSNFMQRLRVARGHEPRYYYYLLNSYVGREYLGCLGSTTTGLRNLSGGLLAELAVSGPPPEEQTQIAAFLEYETAKIDALIEKQRQLIALLEEKRQAVISHAVTKGLNPEAPMRDSGVEWLGEVPAHWDTSRLKFLVSNVVDCHHSTPKYDPNAPCPALRTADVTPGYLDVAGARRVHLDEYEQRISRLKPEPGDIVYSREGERWGIAALIPEGPDVCLAQRVMLFRVNAFIESQFLMWGLNSLPVYNQLAVNVVGATSPHVNISDIREVWLAVPPCAEQVEIVDYLLGVLGRLDRLDCQCSEVIAVLQERRTTLISAAVTGKINVRGWQAPETEAEVA